MKKYDFKTKSRENVYTKSSRNEHSVFCELTLSNKSCLVVNCQSPFTARGITHCGFVVHFLLLVGTIDYFFPLLSNTAADNQQSYNPQYC